jgi:hypothetical protein
MSNYSTVKGLNSSALLFLLPVLIILFSAGQLFSQTNEHRQGKQHDAALHHEVMDDPYVPV